MMDTRTLIKYMLIACTAVLAYLWIISKLAPSPSRSRRQVEYGLNSLHQPTEPSSKNRTDTKDWTKTAVIFVHGLGADPTKTWCDGKTCWITDFLPDDIKQEGLDPFVNLFTFDYDSFWVRDANSATLTHTARDLGQELKHRELAQSNLVLIAHSYGGLVVKKALVLNPDLESRAKAVIFLGTPEEFVYDFYECSKEKIRMREWRDSHGRNNTANHSIDVGDETTNSDDSEGNDFAIAASNIIESNSQHSVQDVEYIKCIGILKAFSFISEQDGGLNMHRLVQLVTKQWLDSQSSSTRFSKEALVVVRRRFPYGKFETREVCRRYLPHAYAAMNNRATGSRMARSHLLYNVASFCVYQYWWADAERFVTEAIDINKNVLGEHAHNTRASMHLLGWIFIQTGRWNKAEKIIDQILESAQQESDGDSRDTIALKHELAELYQHQGRLEEAEQLLLVVVDVKTAMDGVEHPDTLFCARALAWVYQRQHRFKEAEQLFLQVLEAQTRTLGVEHFDTLISKHSLSQSYQRQGRLEEAEQLLLRALEASKRTFGAGHTNTITVKHSLATVWKGMGRTEDAIHLMKECALFDKQVLGADHPHTQISLQCLEDWEPSEEVIDRGDASSPEDEGGDLDKEEDGWVTEDDEI
ncbi:hypothetical protein EDB81DRAFT_813163 [Dactylonectria macrodidyma]|uniref:AB hydrolase-1 domain-containing protein n=1 Tax=Dactylonectria macrodidyma TaxID=307937 RepID=A0A9P9IKP4_9HYPO|nr:hypothetical protein EDB81DRAFT_813163 [Dactylonectria macrodidyma]